MSMCVEKTRKEASEGDTGIACQTHCLLDNVSIFLPSSQRMAGVGDNELTRVSDEQSKEKVHHEHKMTTNNLGVVKGSHQEKKVTFLWTLSLPPLAPPPPGSTDA